LAATDSLVAANVFARLAQKSSHSSAAGMNDLFDDDGGSTIFIGSSVQSGQTSVLLKE
jgi:hypothetical protein